MKKLTLLLMLFGVMAFGAPTEVPKQVMKTFKEMYANVQNESWEMEGANYVASFDHNRLSKLATFSPKGSWMSTIWNLSVGQLMDCITDYIDEEYSNAQIIDVEFVETPSSEKYFITIEEEEIEIYEEEETETEGEGENDDEYIQLVFNTDCDFLSEG